MKAQNAKRNIARAIWNVLDLEYDRPAYTMRQVVYIMFSSSTSCHGSRTCQQDHIFRQSQHTFQGGMEHEAAGPNKKISNICHEKDGIVAMFPAAFDPFISQPYEHEIGQGVYDFGRVVSGIVVLPKSVIDLGPGFSTCCFVP